MLSYFTRTSQRVVLRGLLQIERACTHNHVRTFGNVGDWDADKYSKVASVALKNAVPLLDVLKPQPGERILDLGCGSGELTMVLKDAGSEVVAIDASQSMVEAAKAKGLDVHLLDGHNLNFKEEFDVVFSHMALHWMKKDPRKVVKNIYNALKKNGRFVAEFGGKGFSDHFLNHCMPILKRHGLPFTNPLYTPTEEAYADLLKSEGFNIEHISLLPRGIPVPGGPRTVFDLSVPLFFGDLDDFKKEQIAEELTETIETKYDDEGNFIMDTFIMTVAATK